MIELNKIPEGYVECHHNKCSHVVSHGKLYDVNRGVCVYGNVRVPDPVEPFFHDVDLMAVIGLGAVPVIMSADAPRVETSYVMYDNGFYSYYIPDWITAVDKCKITFEEVKDD